MFTALEGLTHDESFLTGKLPTHQQSAEDAAGAILERNQPEHELGALTIRKRM